MLMVESEYQMNQYSGVVGAQTQSLCFNKFRNIIYIQT